MLYSSRIHSSIHIRARIPERASLIAHNAFYMPNCNMSNRCHTRALFNKRLIAAPYIDHSLHDMLVATTSIVETFNRTVSTDLLYTCHNDKQSNKFLRAYHSRFMITAKFPVYMPQLLRYTLR